MKFLKKIFIFLLVFSTVAQPAQSSQVDSLLVALKNAPHDTSKLSLLFQVVESIPNDDVWIKYNEQAYELAKKLERDKNAGIQLKGKEGLADALNNKGYYFQNKNEISAALDYYDKSLKLKEKLLQHDLSKAQIEKIKNGIATSLNNIGLLKYDQGDVHEAMSYYRRSLKIQEETGNKRDLANSLNNIGLIYDKLGDVSHALNYLDRSLKIREEIGDNNGIATCLNNIAEIYNNQDNNKTAQEYLNRSLKIWEKEGNLNGFASVLHNLGRMLYEQKKTSEALSYFDRSLKIREEIGDKAGLAYSLSSLGAIYFGQNDFSKALEYHHKSLKIRKEIEDKTGIGASMKAIGTVYFNLARVEQAKQKNNALSLPIKKNLTLALSYCDSSLNIAKKLGFPTSISLAEFLHSKIDSTLGNNFAAFEHYKQFIIYRDSTNSVSSRKASVKSQLKYEFDKKEAVIKEQQEKERAVAEEKDQRQQIIILSVAVGLLLVIVFAAFVFRSLKTTRKQKIIIEEKQREILDSIRYAKRIQHSLLPHPNYFDKNLKRMQKNK